MNGGVTEIAAKVAYEYEADVYLYSGPIADEGYGQLASEIGRTKQVADKGNIPSHSRAILILTTNGGQANPAYQIARLFQTQYDEFLLFAPSYCKSSGTIIALGAHRLIMDVFAELGPLDVQLPKENEIFGRRSGLLMRSAFESLEESAFSLFEYFMLEITRRSDGLVSFKTASEISSQLTATLFAPVYGQISPDTVGSDHRDSMVAYHYGIRLAMRSGNVNANVVKHLVENYPAHDFIIDSDEARGLFENVDEPKPVLYELLSLLGDLAYVEQDKAAVRSLVVRGEDDDKPADATGQTATVDTDSESHRPVDSEPGRPREARRPDGFAAEATASGGQSDGGASEEPDAAENLDAETPSVGDNEKNA